MKQVQAFPVIGEVGPDTVLEWGMTLRDWFAGQALACAVDDYGKVTVSSSAGQRRNHGNPVPPYSTSGAGTREQIIARQAYRYADAMMEAREATK